MRYDVIIIGAGSAGAVLATRLSEDAGCSVLLLEAGPDYADFERLPDDLKWGGNFFLSALGPHTWGYTAMPNSERPEPIPLPRGKATGGTSAINGQLILRGTPEDFDAWAAWGNDEWAFSKVLPYYRRLETDMDFGGDDFHGSGGPIPVRRLTRQQMEPYAGAFYESCLAEGFPDCPDHNHPQSAGIGACPVNSRDGVRMSTALAYLNQARHRLNLTLRPNVAVQRILFERTSEGQRAVGVEAESGGERFRLEGDQIVLSAGAIDSPQLLLRSGVGPAAQLREFDIDLVHDLPGVGSNLRDHPYVFFMCRQQGQPPDTLRPPYVQAVLRYTAGGSAARNDVQIGTLAVDSAYLPPDGPIAPGEPCFALYANVQKPRSAGTLRLASADPAVQPVIDYNYLADTADRQRLREAVRLAYRLAQHAAFKGVIIEPVGIGPENLETDEALDAWLLGCIGFAGFHSAGTCKMGPAADAMAVVDQYCRVHGIEGLRVVDASVMPDVVRANTNATTMMIAERVADWMRQASHW